MVNIKNIIETISESLIPLQVTKKNQRDPIPKWNLKTLDVLEDDWTPQPLIHWRSVSQDPYKNESYWVSPENPPICWVKCWVKNLQLLLSSRPLVFDAKKTDILGAATLGSQKVSKKRGGGGVL